MKNKKGWLRIAEAVTGVLLLSSVLLFTFSQNVNRPDISDYTYQLQMKILKDISLDSNLRSIVVLPLGENNAILNKFIRDNLPANFNYSIRICDINANSCNMNDFVSSDVYVQERVISSTLTAYSPKKLRFFIWEMTST